MAFENGSCRLCQKYYKCSTEGRYNLYKKKADKPSVSEKLKVFGILILPKHIYSNTICRTCFEKIKTLEKAKAIKNGWKSVLEKECLKRPAEENSHIPITKKVRSQEEQKEGEEEEKEEEEEEVREKM